MSDDFEFDHITLQGIDLQVLRQGSGPQLLLLHGGGGPQPQLPFFKRLIEHFEVTAPIHPGFAGSPIPDHFDNLEDLVYLHLDLIDALELHDVLLLGFSIGGWAAAEIAVRNIHRVGKLVLVDAVGVKPGDREARDIADLFGQPAADATKLLFHDPANAPVPANMTEEQWTTWAGDRIALAMYGWEPYMHNPKLPYRLHRINRPTLLIWGESDGVVSVDYAKAYQQMIPNAELIIIPEAGHMPQVEQPDIFVDHVLAFASR